MRAYCFVPLEVSLAMMMDSGPIRRSIRCEEYNHDWMPIVDEGEIADVDKGERGTGDIDTDVRVTVDGDVVVENGDAREITFCRVWEVEMQEGERGRLGPVLTLETPGTVASFLLKR